LLLSFSLLLDSRHPMHTHANTYGQGWPVRLAHGAARHYFALLMKHELVAAGMHHTPSAGESHCFHAGHILTTAFG
jgi:hypothetical protein